jgi:hypothetical protein
MDRKKKERRKNEGEKEKENPAESIKNVLRDGKD